MTAEPTTGFDVDELADVVWRLSPAGYLPRLVEGWSAPPHVRMVADAIRDAVAGTGPNRVIVTMPPRHGKSTLVSRAAPVWFLNTWPDRKVGLASYEADFAAEWGHLVREAIREHAGWLDVRLDPNFSNRAAWFTTAGGGMFTAGVGGPFTGRGFDLLIIDDPIKNAVEAASPTVRDRLWSWFTSTAYTRLEPGAAVAVLQTRWHEDDLVGRLLRAQQEGGDVWRVIDLPAIAEPTVERPDPLGRSEGEPLWAARYDAEALARIRAAVGSSVWSALYQGRPVPADGSVFRRSWLRFYSALPAPREITTWLQSWDLSFGSGGANSYVVGQVWAQAGADRYLVDQVRARMDFAATVAAVREMSVKWPQAKLKLVEAKANGPALISTLQREVAGLVPVTPRGSKEARAHAVTPEFESGNVWLPHRSLAPWVDAYVEELLTFPAGLHDDQVDATTQALARLADAGRAAFGKYRDLRLVGRR